MADTTPRAGRGRLGRRDRQEPRHAGHRCRMCGRVVPVDEQGRCPLGHVVAEPSDRAAADRAAADRAAADRAADEAGADGPPGSTAATARAGAPAEGYWPGPAAGWEDAGAGTPPTTPSFATPPPAAPPVHGEVRDASSEVVASFVEPGVAADPTPAAPPVDDAAPAVGWGSAATPAPADPASPAAPHPATSVFDEPPPPIPTDPAGGSPGLAASGSDLPVRVRRPFGDQAPARSLFGEALGDEEPAVRPEREAQQRDTAAFARIVRAAKEQEIPSALDLDDQQWAAASGPDHATYAQEDDEVDTEAEPSRGILQIAAGAAFVLVLLAVAWYLATTL